MRKESGERRCGMGGAMRGERGEKGRERMEGRERKGREEREEVMSANDMSRGG